MLLPIGKNVTAFDVGDAVFGEVFKTGLGSFAEYVTVPDNALALKPSNISYEEASAVPMAGYTALQGLRNKGKIQAGQAVLINGASGGVGTFSVQIAKALGADVTGVCSTAKLALVRSIGADHVIDYTKEDFTTHSQSYDLIFDAVGNRSTSDLKRALKPKGICSIAGFTSLSRMFEQLICGAWVSRFGHQEIGMMDTAHTNQNDLRFLAGLLQSGKVKPVIDTCYPLEETADAIRYLEKGRARGKVLITIAR